MNNFFSKFSILKDLSIIKEIFIKYKFNLYFILYIILSLNFWRKIIILNLILFIFVFFKLLFIILKKKKIIIIQRTNWIDITLYKFLLSSNNKVNFEFVIIALIEFFLRYLIIFLISASIKSLLFCFEFFDCYYTWNPSYSYNKLWKIHRLFLQFLKKKIYNIKISNIEIKHKFLKNLSIIIKN